MKIILISISLLMVMLTGCNTSNEEHGHEQHVEIDERNKLNTEEEPNQESFLTLPIEITFEGARFLVSDLFSLIEGEYVYDEMHRSLLMVIDDQHYYLFDGVPVVEQNGYYLATDEISLIIEGENVYLPIEFLKIALGLSVTYGDSVVTFDWHGPTTKVNVEGRIDVTDTEVWDVDKMIAIYPFYKNQLKVHKLVQSQDTFLVQEELIEMAIMKGSIGTGMQPGKILQPRPLSMQWRRAL